ncbi:MAG: serine/threonine protein kinase, partial [Deltaproteobacteria bacterium]|nr:serine/threonine protein kinase [Nannocystaceae bacterium]
MVMESLQRLDPPQTLGKLTLLARIGEGGMATVYVAAMGQGSLARLCAVKLLRAGAPDVDYRTRFVDEAKVVVRLHHNNLVDVREAGEHLGQLFIVMELCEGRDLADVWDRCAEVGKAFPVALAVHIVREALRGLHYAHTFPGLGLVHRDISPSNLLIDWAGAVRVADFGLATSVLKVTNTMPGMVFGKVGYMAPEQATRGDVDPRADVYGCGVVLWELLTGRPLRDVGVDTRTVAKFAAHPPSMLSRRVDPDLDAIVVRALETAPADRFEDAGAFMRALSEWLGANAPHTTQETLSEFMRLLFADVQVRDHQDYGALLESLAHPVTGVFRRVDTHETTREVPSIHMSEELAAGVVVAERYRIEQTLGRGGMGTVYLAEHVTVGRKVAVKVLTREWSTHDVVARRFKEEARAASAAGHPNIVEVFDAGRLPDGRLYLVMEYLVGRSLYQELVEGGRMGMERAVGIVREITRAVGAAHSVGIIHRDLKPDNVMLVTRGGEVQVKVLDFGISASAERAADDRRLTQPGHALGTPEYMAPEQAKGRPPNERVDIYALGVIAYELLAGEPPFVSENFVEVLARKATEPAPPLDRTRDDLPPALVRLIHDCLEIEPTRRPASAAELLTRL